MPRSPNIWADVPDMAIIRVGNVYYMSSTTMHLHPGVPIMRSEDLHTWEVIRYVYDVLDEDSDALALSGANAYGRGSWASSINHHQGRFYVTSFSYTTNKTYIWHTDNIETGAFNTIELPEVYHDASLLFDGGRVYLAYGHENIQLIELEADLSAVKPGGLQQTIIANASAVAGSEFILKAEGTQIQKIHGWYYVSNICWPKGQPRTQIVHRSRSLTGPYEGRVVLDSGVAQGEYISTPAGDWYLYAFRDSGAVGRLPWLIPIVWRDDWPVVEGTTAAAVQEAPAAPLTGLIKSDDFTAATLDRVWQWNHRPADGGWSLTARPGFMRLINTRRDTSFVDTRSTLTQRMFGPTSTASVTLELTGFNDGDTAGLGALQSHYGFVAVAQEGGQRALIMVNAASGEPVEMERIPLAAERIHLRIAADFREQRDRAYFYYSLDGQRWQRIGDALPMSYRLDHFMGYRFALFSFARDAPGGHADFDRFEVTGDPPR